MLVLTRKTDERILIGDSIVVAIVRIDRNTVRIAIEAPADVPIVREELLARTTAPRPREETPRTGKFPAPLADARPGPDSPGYGRPSRLDAEPAPHLPFVGP